MTDRIPVVADLAAFRVAVAGLPLQAEPALDPAGAIVVVDGAGRWWDAADLAVDGGASAVLVAEPQEVPIEVVAELAARADVPIVVHRSRLREDLVDLAVEERDGVDPRIIVGECRAASDGLAAVVRDAVGWTRALARTEVAVAAASVSSGAGTVLLRSRGDDRIAGSLVLAVTRSDGALLRMQALGEVTTELEIDEAAGRSEVVTSTTRGRHVAPTRFESAERAALRRSIEAVVRGRSPRDLVDLVHDAEATAVIFGDARAPRSLVDL